MRVQVPPPAPYSLHSQVAPYSARQVRAQAGQPALLVSELRGNEAAPRARYRARWMLPQVRPGAAAGAEASTAGGGEERYQPRWCNQFTKDCAIPGVGRDASGGAGGGACAWTEAPANSRKDRDNVATPNLTIIPFTRAKRRLAVTRVTGIRAVLRHAAHGPPRARFPAIRHVETVGAAQVKCSPMELCKPAISLRLDSAPRYPLSFPFGAHPHRWGGRCGSRRALASVSLWFS